MAEELPAFIDEYFLNMQLAVHGRYRPTSRPLTWEERVERMNQEGSELIARAMKEGGV